MTAGTGPYADHTTSITSGHYLYTEASTPREPGDMARLTSPSFPATTGACFTFNYHMYGDHMGTLKVYVYNDGDVTGNPIWSQSGNQGSQWKQLNIYVVRKTNYRLAFEGVIGSGYRSDIALDDISLTPGLCS
ncbi:MAM domain-containing glycosylphosphatidylinositol anchor protein 2-like isoform X2 [Glandiceps talaboti]